MLSLVKISAIAALFLSALAHSAKALTLADRDGLASVSLVPIFSLEKGDSLEVSILNSTEQTKALKIRAQGSGSEQIFFNLYLPPKSSWTGKLSQTSTGSATEFLSTSKKGCVLGNTQINSPISSGQLEILEMGQTSNLFDSCQDIATGWQPAGLLANRELSFTKPSGGLLVHARWMRALTQSTFKVPVTGFNNWSQIALHFPPDINMPQLEDVNPKQTLWISSKGIQRLNWSKAPPITPFVAAITHSAAFTEYESSPIRASSTSVVIFNPFQDCIRLEVMNRSLDAKGQTSATTTTSCSTVGVLPVNESPILKPTTRELVTTYAAGRLTFSGENILLKSDEGQILTGSPSRVYRLTEGQLGEKPYTLSSEAKYQK